MKRTLLTLFVTSLYLTSAYGQTGIVYTVAGCTACSTTSVDGVPATSALLVNAAGISTDSHGNIYIADAGNNRVRMISASTGDISTFAGTSIAAFSGDGGLANAAQISHPQGIFIDTSDNVYIADAGNDRIRKVDGVTHIISTVAGGGSSAADGIAATTAMIRPMSLYVDASGNIYEGDANKLRKINTAGVITTIAGNGTFLNSGDGGPATDAGISGQITSVAMDPAGNLYIVPESFDRVRRIDAGTGIITTFAGGGYCASDGIPATSAAFDSVYSCASDGSGNIIIADFHGGLMRQVDTGSGIIHTIAGGGTSTADGIPATSAAVYPYIIYIDRTGSNIYYSNDEDLVRRITYFAGAYVGYFSDSFAVSINKLCDGPQLIFTTIGTYLPTMSIKSWFGDGTTATSSFVSTCMTNSIDTIRHAYDYCGTYTMKHVLYNAATAVDSIEFSYEVRSCSSFKIYNYYDENSDCTKESFEPYICEPVVTEVDSDSVPIDTISSTSGFYFNGTGGLGTTYQFKILAAPPLLLTTCPISTTFNDTVDGLPYNSITNYFGFTCSPSSTYDFSIIPNIERTSQGEYWGYAYAANAYGCAFSIPDTVILKHDSYYNYWGVDANPSPTSYTDSTITWILPAISGSSLTRPTTLFFETWHDRTVLPLKAPGDTTTSIFKILPIVGDIDTTNNVAIVVDTITAGFDPNFMSVSPSGCTPIGTRTLQYTINFENTGNDTAFNIHILDTLSADLDPRSMRIVLASAPMTDLISTASGYNVLKFDFPGINLLDSSHHGQCDGVVMFTIDLKDGLAAGTQVYNQAGIYFDVNPVVMTNEVENITGCATTSVAAVHKSKEVSIYPNPAANELDIMQNGTTYDRAVITNILGQQSVSQTLGPALTRMDIKALPPGVYCITLTDDSGTTTVKKFMKM